ncbi:MAG: Lrp/AsnC family transcriptional regulator [bacterium]|nr:MAG: Lrp/AsnC family transcriptional regulator [bacterium]
MMDNIDYKILSLLQNNARVTNAEIARQIGMVPSGVLERVRKLEENELIQEYTARLKPEPLNLGLLAFVFVRTSESPGSTCISEELAKFPEIMEVHHVAGEDCYLIKIRLKDNKSLAAFLRKKIGSISAVTFTRTVIVLETIKETSKVKLPEPEE